MCSVDKKLFSIHQHMLDLGLGALAQARFREKLLDAYGARCAITGTAVASTLQAAHIVPYRGPQTNAVGNGILLRADIHNLFDMGLIQIEPTTYKIRLSEELLSSG